MRLAKRSAAIKPLTAFALVAVMLFTMGADKCSDEDKATALSIAKQVVPRLETVKRVAAVNGFTSEYLDLTLASGKSLITALEGNGDAGQIGSELIAHFENLIADSERITNPLTRTIIMVALSEVNYQLRRLLDKIDLEEQVAAPSAQPSAIAKFTSRRKVWRCRTVAAIDFKRADGSIRQYRSGVYVPMEACSQLPANTTVETR